MSLINTAASWAKRLLRKSDPVLIETSAQLAAALGTGYSTVTGQSLSTRRSMQQATVFGCVRVLAESVGMLPCRLFTEQGKKPATEHRLYRLLALAPNDYMTAIEFWELLMTCLCLRGNFYAYKVYGLGGIAELLPIDPDSVTPKLKDDWQVEYRVTFPNGSEETLSQREIWHVRLFTLDGLTGLNPIAYARNAISLGLNLEEHGQRLFTNGARPSGVLQTDQSLTDKAFDRLKTEFNEDYGGLANAYKPMVLEMGLEWKPISLNAEDSQFLESRKYQRDEICAIYRVPPHLVANLEKATFNNVENLGLSFVAYSLVPYLTRIEQRIRVGLLSESDQLRYYAKFNTGALLRGDLKSRYEAYGTGINWGFLSPNDCRELEDLPPREGGDLYLTPLNMTTNPGAEDENKATP